MEFKTTNKEIKNNYYNIICIGYADLQNLLNYENPIAYGCGVYGWNYDVYQVFDNTVIITGYRPFGNIRPKYEKIRDIDSKACKLLAKWKANPETLHKMLVDFVNDVLIENGRK